MKFLIALILFFQSVVAGPREAREQSRARAKLDGTQDCVAAAIHANTKRYWPFDDRIRNKETGDDAAWESLQSPNTGTRTRGLKELQKIANRDGLFVVVPEKTPTTEGEKEFFEKLYGVPVVFAGDYEGKKTFTTLNGLALHPGNAPELANRVRGTINPHLGYEKLHHELDNKIVEAEFAKSISKDAMPPFKSAWEVIPKDRLSEFDKTRREAMDAILYLLNNPNVDATRSNEEKIGLLLRRYIEYSRTAFPEGAFLKRIDDSMGMEGGGLLNTMADEKTIRNWIKEFIDELGGIQDTISKPKNFDEIRTSADAERLLKNADDPYLSTSVMRALLFEPEKLLIQRTLNPEVSPMGKPLEFRVIFIDGESVYTEPRHSYEYLPEQTKKASEFLTKFFNKAPEKYQYLSGGADVMLDKNGNYYFIEFNFGSQPGGMDPWWTPIYGNQFISALQGKPTPLLKELETVYQLGSKAQIEFLGQVEKRGSILYYSIHEVFHWFKDRAIKEVIRKPSREAANRTLEEIKKIYDAAKVLKAKDAGDLAEIEEIYQSAVSDLKAYTG